MEIGLKHVLIQGKPYPVFYGMYGFARIMKQSGLTLNQVLAKTGEFTNLETITGDDLMFLFDFIHAGFVTGSEVAGEKFPFGVAQLSALLPLTGKEVETVFEAFMETMPQVEEDQKKVVPKAKQKAKAPA